MGEEISLAHAESEAGAAAAAWLGESLLVVGDLERAQRALEVRATLYANHPGITRIRLLLAEVHRRRGDLDGAEQCLAGLVTTGAPDPSVQELDWLVRGMIAEARGTLGSGVDADQVAMVLLGRYLQRAPPSPVRGQALCAFARAAQRQGRWLEALSAARLCRQPGHGEAATTAPLLEHQATLALQLPNSLAALEREIEDLSAGERGPLLLLLGEEHMRSGSLERARQAFAKLIDCGGPLADRGRCLELTILARQGLHDAVIRAAPVVIAEVADPDLQHQVRWLWGHALRGLGHHQQAAEVWSEVAR
jgi:tetratricopeptide (TPR) repeat protein